MAQQFFLTDQETRLVHLYVRNAEKEAEKKVKFEKEIATRRVKVGISRAQTIHYDDHVYYPESWETLNQKEIEGFRRSFTKKYLWWGLTNKTYLADRNIEDASQTFSVFKEIVYSTAMMMTTAYFLNNFMKKMDPPIFDFFLFQKKSFQPKHLRIGFLAVSMLGIQYRLITG